MVSFFNITPDYCSFSERIRAVLVKGRIKHRNSWSIRLFRQDRTACLGMTGTFLYIIKDILRNTHVLVRGLGTSHFKCVVDPFLIHHVCLQSSGNTVQHLIQVKGQGILVHPVHFQILGI